MATVSDITHDADAFRRAYPDHGRTQAMSTNPERAEAPYELPDPGSREFLAEFGQLRTQTERTLTALHSAGIRRTRELHHRIADLEGERDRLKAAIVALADQWDAEAQASAERGLRYGRTIPREAEYWQGLHAATLRKLIT